MHIDAAPAETQPLAGTASPQTQPVPPPQTQPLAGTAFPQTQPPQTQPLVLQALPQTQPLAEDARGDDGDDNDHEGLDSRAAVGEQSVEEETAQAERQHQGEDSEAEEIAVKLKVSAVVRFARAPNHRFRPAVGGIGGGGAAATLDMQVHQHALWMGEGVKFTLTSLTEKNEQGKWFVPAQTFDAITHSHRLKKDDVPSCQGGWCLVCELPDTDELSGIHMSDSTFASRRWQGDPSLILKHLLKNTRGNWLSWRVGG